MFVLSVAVLRKYDLYVVAIGNRILNTQKSAWQTKYSFPGLSLPWNSLFAYFSSKMSEVFTNLKNVLVYDSMLGLYHELTHEVRLSVRQFSETTGQNSPKFGREVPWDVHMCHCNSEDKLPIW